MAAQRNHSSRSVEPALLADLNAMTAQLPEGASFNRRLSCVLTELRALKSVLPIQIPVPVPTEVGVQLGTLPYLGSDVFPHEP